MSDELKLISQIENMVFEIRGQRVMMDSDLARLYGVETKHFNRQIKRNIERFPHDFMFECSFEELEELRRQIGAAIHVITGMKVRDYFSEHASI